MAEASSDAEEFPVGTWVVDGTRQRLGRVMGHEGPYIQLRPPGGGREWDVRPESVREAVEHEILRARRPETGAATERRP
ncbi:hypothetical protein AB0C93_15380 [Streptomyces sp. NPDC048518]|uniref:hypothetical protein n=1 Tax=Streptomyces sp. NPDC048518 TaxID=3155029 RepID=UPI0033F0DC17